jgi:ATP-dependent exoDNAse (exonuclease V) beta subunit
MELLIYKASAGAGKTFTLAVEYIKHLIRNPRAYRQILAVTFTNKATGEMKSRILQQLHGIWKGEIASEPYLNRIREEIGQPVDTIRQAAGTALLYMLHDYSRFRVETIDSFFQSVMRNLARELELSPNLNIELNAPEVLSDAVDSLIEKLTPTSPVLAWLLDYINERIADDKRWNVAGELKRFGQNILDEEYMERGEGLRKQLKADPALIATYRKELRAMMQEATRQMQQLGERFETTLEEHALAVEELKNGSKGIASYFRKLREGKLSDKDAKNATLDKCLADAANWVTKTSPRKKEILTLVEATLLPLLQKAESLRPADNRIVNSCRLSLQYLNNLQLLTHIDEEVRLLNREQNRFLLSDTNALLHSLVRDGDSSFVFEKIGANIRNVMIDEFQDTSRLQWDNFKTLLFEGLSQGADSLIVGDVKQSIYRWRNGDWRILNSLGSDEETGGTPRFPFPVRIETLKTNRRSETNIIDFNNRLFARAVNNLNQRHLEELGEPCPTLLRAYADVEQSSPRTDRKGYVKVTFIESDDRQSYTAQTIEELGDEVQHLLHEGVDENDIAILVRKNKDIPAIADYFDSVLHLSVVSDEAFRLNASRTVGILIDALRLIANPDDKIAHASLEAQGIVLDDPAAYRIVPLYELLEELYRLLELRRLEMDEDAYLFAFFDAVNDYLQSNSSDPEAFLRYWDETLSAKAIPGGEASGIRILSIHKSKGLEFHTVLIPFCDWTLTTDFHTNMLWCTPTEAPFSLLELVPVNYSALMAESVYRTDYLNERLQLWVDNLNLLYVAFTRAGKNLIVWSRKNDKNSIAELLANTLKPDGDDTAVELFETGNLCRSLRKERAKSSIHVNMQSLHPDIEFRQSNRSADFIAGTDEDESPYRFIRRGRLLHTLFSTIRTEADIDPAIDRLLFEGVIDSHEADTEIRPLTHKAFALPQIKEWYSGTWQLFNECDIIWQEDGELHTRRPDRVMMKTGEIVVLDFKFGKPRREYAEQIQVYLDLLVCMGYSSEQMTGYLWYVEQGDLERIDHHPA